MDSVRVTDAHHTMRILWPLAFAALMASAGVALSLSRYIIRPLQDLEREVSTIQHEDLTRRVPVRGNDEVSSLASAFNDLLDRLQESFGTQRRFLDDAGHELRTPITIVRGHLELLTENPSEQEETIALVLSELDRMNRIVTDLLALAKAERPDFVCCEDDVDIAQLTLDFDAKVMLLGERQWTVSQVADGMANVDSQRLTQAVMQLAQNAVQHTKVGDVIEISTSFGCERGSPEWLEIRCCDTGTGISDEDKKNLFDRFHRGSAASRSSFGAGLGLAIVQAIASGHGGSVRVEDTPGGGATFIVRVPRYGCIAQAARI